MEALGFTVLDWNTHVRQQAVALLKSVNDMHQGDGAEAVMEYVRRKGGDLPVYARLAAIDAVCVVAMQGDGQAITRLFKELGDEVCARACVCVREQSALGGVFMREFGSIFACSTIRFGCCVLGGYSGWPDHRLNALRCFSCATSCSPQEWHHLDQTFRKSSTNRQKEHHAHSRHAANYWHYFKSSIGCDIS